LNRPKIFLDIEDDDNYDEEGDNQLEKNITPVKSALKPWKRFTPTANFMIFKILSITASK